MRLSLTHNFSWTFLGNVVHAGCRWGMLIMLAKMGNPGMVGQFALGLAVVDPIVMFGNMNLRTVLATDARRENDFADCLGLRLITASLSLVLVILIACSLGYRMETALIIIMVGLAKSIESVSDVFHGLIQQHERMDRIAKSMIIKGPLSLVMLGVGTYITGSLLWGVVGMAVAWLLVLLSCDIRSARLVLKAAVSSVSKIDGGKNSIEVECLQPLHPRWELRKLQKLLHLALPLGFVMLLIGLNANTPRYFIEHFFGERQLGIFAAVASFMSIGTMVVIALGQSAYPRLARYFTEGHHKSFLIIILKLLGVAVLLGGAGFFVAFVAGQQILTLLFGAEYASHWKVLLWIMAAAGIFYVASVFGYGITAARYFKTQVPLFAFVAGVTTVSCFVLIPNAGLRGAAMSLFIGAIVQVISSFFLMLYALLKSKQRADLQTRIAQGDNVIDQWLSKANPKPLTINIKDHIPPKAPSVLTPHVEMDSFPQVSVIIPTHNRPEFLRLAITSVLKQTFQDFEIIVVDDASTDHTCDVVWSFNDSRIQYIRLSGHSGDAGTRNAGVMKSTGKFIAFLDDDDEWLPEKLHAQVSILTNSAEEICGMYTGRLNVDVKTGEVLNIRPALKRGNLFHEMLSNNRITTSSVLLKRSCLEELGLFDQRMPCGSDQDLWIRLSRKYHWDCIATALVRYGVHPRKLTTDWSLKTLAKEMLMERYHNLLVLTPEVYSQHYYALGTMYCLNGDIEKGRASYIQAIALFPYHVRPYLVYCITFLGVDGFKKILDFWNKGGKRLPADCLPYDSMDPFLGDSYSEAREV